MGLLTDTEESLRTITNALLEIAQASISVANKYFSFILFLLRCNYVIAF